MFLPRLFSPDRTSGRSRGGDWYCEVIAEERSHPLCRELLTWYHVQTLAGAVPKGNVTAESFPPRLLPHLALLDVLPAGAFRYRLFGTARREAYGADLTGRLLSEAETGEPNAHTHRLFRSVVEGRAPIVTRTRYRAMADIGYDRVIIPLADAADTVRWLLTTVQKIEGPPRKSVLELTLDDPD